MHFSKLLFLWRCLSKKVPKSFAERQQENREGVAVINSRADREDEVTKKWQQDEESCMAGPRRVGSVLGAETVQGTSDYKKNYK